MDSKKISKCKYCFDYYCMECSNAYNWEEFCSKECEEGNKHLTTT